MSEDNIDSLLKKYEDFILKKEPLKNLEKLEKEIKSAINDLEEVDYPLYGHYKYKYHSIRSAYLQATNNRIEAEKNDSIVKTFEQYAVREKMVAEFLEEQSSESWANVTNMSFIEFMSKIKQNFQEAFYNDFAIFRDANKNVVTDLDIYINLYDKYQKLIVVIQTMANEYDKEVSNDSDKEVEGYSNDSNTNKEREDLFCLLTIAQGFLADLFKDISFGFLSHCQSHAMPEKVIFKGITTDLNSLRIRHRYLSRIFHPDKASYISTREEDKLFLGQFMALINSNKKKLEDQLEKLIEFEKDVEEYERKGNEFFKYSNDYQKCANGKFSELEVVNKSDIRLLTKLELLKKSREFNEKALEQYKLACRLADKFCIREKQLEFRKSMAICLYCGDRFIEAQLAAISIFIIGKNFNCPNQSEYINQAKKILERIQKKGSSQKEEANKASNETVLNENSSSSPTQTTKQTNATRMSNELVIADINLKDLLPYNGSAQCNTDSANTALKAVARSFFLEIDRSKTARLEASLAFKKGVKELSLLDSFLTISAASSFGFSSIAIAVPVLVVSSVFTIALYPFSFNLLVEGVNDLVKQKFLESKSDVEKAIKLKETRKKLNASLQMALKLYDSHEYLAFISVISNTYSSFKDEHNEEVNLSLIKSTWKNYELIDMKIDPVFIINELARHELAPDAISYFLNLIANVLMSGHVKCTTLPLSEQQFLAKTILIEIWTNHKLEKVAKRMDEKITKFNLKMLKSINQSNRIRKMKDFGRIRKIFGIKTQKEKEEEDDEYNIKEIIKEEDENGPCSQRLNEVKLIAKLNSIILTIITSGLEEGGLEALRYSLNEIKEKIDKSTIIDREAIVRLELIDLFLWFSNGEVFDYNNRDLRLLQNEEEPSVVVTETQSLLNTSQIEQLNILDLRIQNEIGKEAKSRLMVQKAEIFEKILFKFRQAYKYYHLALVTFSSNKMARLGAIRCLTCLKAFKQAQELIAQMDISCFDYFYSALIVYRNSNQLEKARKMLNELKKVIALDNFYHV